MIAELAVLYYTILMHMQGVRHFFEFLLKCHGPISGWATVLDVGYLVFLSFNLKLIDFTMSICIRAHTWSVELATDS